MNAQILIDTAASAKALKDALLSARNVVVLTGAGISTESGIPDFRSPGGIWSRMQPITFQDFVASEEARLEDWERRFAMMALVDDAEPNAAHRAIAHAAANGPVSCVVTQNIDGLHTRAGTPEDKLIEIHGAASYATCLDCGRRSTLADAKRTIAVRGHAPRCSRCSGLVKAAVISFGQAMPEEAMLKAQEASVSCDLFIAAGTSLVVYPAAALPQMAKAAGARIIIASRAPTEQDSTADLIIRSPLAESFAPIECLEFR